MELSELQRTLIQNLLGKARDENTLKEEKEIKDLDERSASRGFSKFSSGPAISEEFDIRFKYLQELANKYKKIYLDVLAPDNALISEELLNYILENTKENLNGPILEIKQTIDDYKRINRRLNLDGHFKKKLDDKLLDILQEIKRDLLIDQSKRKLSKTGAEETRVDSFVKYFKNNRVFSLFIIIGLIIIAIGTFADSLRNIFNVIKPYIEILFSK